MGCETTHSGEEQGGSKKTASSSQPPTPSGLALDCPLLSVLPLTGQGQTEGHHMSRHVRGGHAARAVGWNPEWTEMRINLP